MHLFGLILFVLLMVVLFGAMRIFVGIVNAISRFTSLFTPTGQQRRQNPRQQQYSRPQPTPKRKKIDPNVGEYVSYDEISVTESDKSSTDGDSSPQASRTSPTESQISDAEWEEL